MNKKIVYPLLFLIVVFIVKLTTVLIANSIIDYATRFDEFDDTWMAKIDMYTSYLSAIIPAILFFIFLQLSYRYEVVLVYLFVWALTAILLGMLLKSPTISYKYTVDLFIMIFDALFFLGHVAVLVIILITKYISKAIRWTFLPYAIVTISQLFLHNRIMKNLWTLNQSSFPSSSFYNFLDWGLFGLSTLLMASIIFQFFYEEQFLTPTKEQLERMLARK